MERVGLNWECLIFAPSQDVKFRTCSAQKSVKRKNHTMWFLCVSLFKATCSAGRLPGALAWQLGDVSAYEPHARTVLVELDAVH